MTYLFSTGYFIVKNLKKPNNPRGRANDGTLKFRHMVWVIPYYSYGMSHTCRLNLTFI